MIVSVSEQAYVFLATLYGGIVIGFIYDLYRIFRCIFQPKKLATLIQDFIFWIVIAVAAVGVLLFSNDGQLRFYTFLGFAVGAILYITILSQYVLQGMMIVLRILKKLLCMIIDFFLYPVKILVKLFRRPWHWILKKLQPIYHRIQRIKKLPKRWYREMKKYVKLILKKK